MTDMSFDKTPWRDENVRFMKQALGPWWIGEGKGRRFGGSIVEWAGDTGDASYKKVSPVLAPNAHFYAVDRRAGSLMALTLRNLPKPGEKLPFTPILEDGYATPINLMRDGVRVALINLDTTNVAREDWHVTHRAHLREMVEEGTRANPRCLGIILNHVFDRPGGTANTTVSERIKIHGEEILKTFRFTPRDGAPWTMDRDDLMAGSEQAEESGFGGSNEGEFAGGFHIYRSNPKEPDGSHRNRMITVRLAFNATDRIVTVYRRNLRAVRR